MHCRAAYLVQSLEDFSFLRADGEGGVASTHLFTAAMPFNTAESALEAVEDHCYGRGSVIRIWVPEQ